MKVIIAGGRDFDSYELLAKTMKEINNVTEIVCGKARGADTLGEQWAKENNIPVTYFPALWNLGRDAGIKRNHQMGDYADYLVAFWDGESRGTKDMIDYMKRLGKKGTVVTYVRRSVNV